MIELTDISMRFFLGREKITNLKEYLIKRIKQTARFDEFWALKGVSFSVQAGEVFGIIGPNGAGKSTLLKIVAGVMSPTKGTLHVKGNISPLIELGAGFDFDLTARDNIYLNGAVLGYQKSFIRRKFDEIVAFSELEEFIDVPLKNYSTGMIARIAFSIATIVEPEILIIDEILAVGDMRFQEKSEAKIRSIMDNGATVLFVSHNLAKVETICHRALWLEKGAVRMIGNAVDVCDSFKANGSQSK